MDDVEKHIPPAATLLTPAAFYAAGLSAKTSYWKRAGLLAAEAWVDADLTNIACRVSVRRERLLDVPVAGDFSNTWCKTSANPLNAPASFPSGHTAWEFTVTTVIAHRHSHHKWIVITAYSLAVRGAASRATSCVSNSRHSLIRPHRRIPNLLAHLEHNYCYRDFRFL